MRIDEVKGRFNGVYGNLFKFWIYLFLKVIVFTIFRYTIEISL